ncbi:MAG: class I SAM-dependent methyltransferase [bacterium]|nr:class I SAM-dependent methyltransferase [bacterium]MDD5756601.1 class I SAM-dependent methyltransferase [bacterium]
MKVDLHFWFMTILFMLRDLLFPRENILQETGIKPGYNVLDYGCGPGSYILPLANLVGEAGKVYAQDINSRAVQAVQKIVADNKLTNVITIQSDCKTGLPDAAIDAVLLYDVFHGLSNPDSVLPELYRILKINGILSFTDHHTKEKEILDTMKRTKLFGLLRKGKNTYTFIKLINT